MRTEAVTAPGYIHDVMATTFVLFITSPAFGKLGADLARHGLDFCHSRNPTGVLLPDGRSLVLTMDRAANAAQLNAAPGGRGRSLPRRHRRGRARRAVALRHARRRAVDARHGDAAARARPGGAARAAWRRGSARRCAPAGPGSRRATSRTWSARSSRPGCCMPGLGPESAFSGEIGRVIAFALEAAGAPIVKGGAAKAVAAFEALIREQGGEVRTGRRCRRDRRLGRTGERRAARERRDD